MSLRKALSIISPAAILLAASVPASAQPSLDSLDLDPAVKNQIRALVTAPATTPGSTFGSPIAFGANLGDVFASIGGTENTVDSDPNDYDGGMTIGFGLGDAKTAVGAEISVGIISIEDSFGSDGNINFKLHTLLPGSVAIAAGVENVGRFGDAEGTSSGHYMAASKAWHLRPNNPGNPMTLITNIGVGDNTFDGDDGTSFGGFGSVALFFSRQVGAILDYKADRLNAGLSVVPFRSLPVNITIGASNVTEEDDEDVAFAGSVGVNFNFLR